MRVLLVEDDINIADSLLSAFRNEMYMVDHVDNGEQADSTLRFEEYDLVVLDLGLPKLSGLEVLKRLRFRKNQVNVLVLTVLDSVDDRVTGLNAGADDYLSKPFDCCELMARVRALTRRGTGQGNIIQCGGLSYDNAEHGVRIGGKKVDLSMQELKLLHILLLKMNKLVTKDHLIHCLCSFGEEITKNAVEVYISRLRKKISQSNAEIKTIRGLGYLLEEAS